MKKFFCLVLIAGLVLFNFSACSNKNDNNNGKNDAYEATENNPENSAAPEDPRLSVSDDLPEANFEGSNFNVLYLNWATYIDYYWADEEIGEVMNDALYRREKDTENRFNVNIEKTPTNYGTVSATLGKSIKAGSHEYDLTLTHCWNELNGLISQNMILDWHTVPYLNFEKPWWINKNAENESLMINGKMFLAVSDFVIPDPNVTFFNKKLLTDLGLEDPYQLVRDGKWTYDKLHEMGKAAGMDLNGDGEMTDEDRYGLVTQLDWYFNTVPQTSGIKVASSDESGRLIYTSDTERLTRLLVAVESLINDISCTFTYDYGAKGDQYISALPLSTGRVLFHWDPLFRALSYRPIEFDYGILPWPKLDENQKNYAHFSHNGFMVVPQTTINLEKTGIIVEALSAESYKYCIPAYYDVLMGVKLTRDLDSVEMLDLIYNTCVFDPGMNYTEGDAMAYGFKSLIKDKSTDFVSYYEKRIKTTQNMLDKLYEAVLKLD